MLKNKRSSRTNRIATKRNLAFLPILILLLSFNPLIAQSTVINVDSFDKVVVSPHIEVVFVEGETESVTVDAITVPQEKLNVEVKNNTLSVYLEGAKMTTDTKKVKKNGYKMRVPIYNGTAVKAIVTYKNLNKLDLRGEQRFVFESPLNTDELKFNVYGESQVYINEINVNNLFVSIYGESVFNVEKGKARNQKYTAYGESTVNASNIKSDNTKLTAYGDGSFQFNVADRLKVTSYGEATITYAGSPTVNRGIIIGDTSIVRADY